MREEKKTVFDYLGQIFMLYGMTVCIFIVFSLTIGDYAKKASPLFSLGDEGLRFSTLLQLLGMATLITLIRNLFFTDILIKNMSVVKRAICMLIGIIVMIIAFVVAFDWFPVNKIEAWIGFFVSFGICFVISLGVTLLKRKSRESKDGRSSKKNKQQNVIDNM